MIRLLAREAVGTGKHRAGWPYVLKLLERLESPGGILFDDFVELNFLYGQPKAHFEPWVGIFHHPPNLPPQISGPVTHFAMFRQPAWKASLPYLKMAFTLTEYLAAALRPRLAVPVVPLSYVTPMNVPPFTAEAFLNNDNRQIAQIGWPWRNTLAIEQLPILPGFQKMAIDHTNTPRTGWVNRYHARVDAYWKNGSRPIHGGVNYVPRLDNQQYDDLLSRNVVFMELFDGSGKTLLVECMARSTPIVVNSHPAMQEYLGNDYPLFYNRFEDAPALFIDERLLEGHQYLREMDKSRLNDEHLMEELTTALTGVVPSV